MGANGIYKHRSEDTRREMGKLRLNDQSVSTDQSFSTNQSRFHDQSVSTNQSRFHDQSKHN